MHDWPRDVHSTNHSNMPATSTSQTQGIPVSVFACLGVIGCLCFVLGIYQYYSRARARGASPGASLAMTGVAVVLNSTTRR